MNDELLRQRLAPLRQVTSPPAAVQRNARQLALESLRSDSATEKPLPIESRWSWRDLLWPLAWAACAFALIAKPEPGRQRPAAPHIQPSGPTQITSAEAAYNEATREAVFTGQVSVQNPRFTITCDRLLAILPSGNNALEMSPTARSSSTAPDTARKTEPQAANLERAIAEAAEGNQVIVSLQKVEPDGSITRIIGSSAKLSYNAANGEFVLTGSPSVQQGTNTCLSAGPNTVMTLDHTGRLRVSGPHRNLIKDTTPAGQRR